MDGNKFVAFFNKRLDINRFFVADSNTEGATPDMPKVESGAGTGEDNGDDPFENSLEDALCVFKSGGGDTDILKDNEKQILFYVDLENEQIVEKDKKKSQTNQDAD